MIRYLNDKPTSYKTFICKFCGKSFKRHFTQNGVYCSRKCQSDDGSVDLTCELCGKKFTRPKSHVLRGIGKYCSRECQTKAKAGYTPNGIKIENNCVCLNCNKEFYVNKYDLENRRGKYCSKTCFREHKKKIKCICRYCGKEFFQYQSAIKDGKGKHCSRECHNKSMKNKPLPERTKEKLREFYKTHKNPNLGNHLSEEAKKRISEHHKGLFAGEKNPNWKGGLSFGQYCKLFNNTFKEKVRERFDRKCFLCGKTEEEEGKRMSIHHVDYFKLSICRGKDWAFVPLCNRCHLSTNNNRWKWFCLLINYWALNPEINLDLNFQL